MPEPIKELAAASSPRFAVRIPGGLVSHIGDAPILTYEHAEIVRENIVQALGVRGEIEEVLLHVET